MTARLIPSSADPVRPTGVREVTVTYEGRPLRGFEGQSIAGVLLANGIDAWRRTAIAGEARGLFCGIGVCFDCVLQVNGRRDVRACQRQARDGDQLVRQDDVLPARGGEA